MSHMFWGLGWGFDCRLEIESGESPHGTGPGRRFLLEQRIDFLSFVR